MRVDSWAGLVTNASPFALPAGAALEQVNLTCVVPGQIQSRGGMRPVSFSAESSGMLDCHAASFGGVQYLVALGESGGLVFLSTPAFGEESQPPQEPSLSVQAGERAFSYTARYLDGSYSSVEDSPPTTPEPAPLFTSLLSGGLSATGQWPYSLDAQQPCEGPGVATEIDGGQAATAFSQSLPLTSLCET